MSKPNAASDPLGALEHLGAVWSPDLDAYLGGERDARRLRCALCGKAPCKCRFCEATYENRYYLATGRPQFEPCGMRADPATGECPRGHAAADTLCSAPECPVTAIVGEHTPGLATSGPAGAAECIADAEAG